MAFGPTRHRAWDESQQTERQAQGTTSKARIPTVCVNVCESTFGKVHERGRPCASVKGWELCLERGVGARLEARPGSGPGLWLVGVFGFC